MTTSIRVCRLYEKRDIRVELESIAPPGPGEVLLAIGHGGICGSDLHYYQDGGFGPIRVSEPIIMGHEAAGRILAVGDGVEHLAVGDVCAINPSQPCGECQYCREGKPQHCLNMEFMGSALRVPHCQGMYRDQIVVKATQCHPFRETPDTRLAACSEPLAVCLHASRRAGDLNGKRVLVTGAGPIGLLCSAVAKHRGASELVVTDRQDFALELARRVGATQTINITKDDAKLDPYKENKGHFDVVFECSAASSAIRSAIECVRPIGTIIQVGVSGDQPVPINMLVGKEVRFIGTHRFHEEFAEAVSMIDSGAIDVSPVVTQIYPLDDAREAFETAGDRSKASKVLLSFAE